MIHQAAVEADIDASNEDMTAVVSMMHEAGLIVNGRLTWHLWRRFSRDQNVAWAVVDYPRIVQFVRWIKADCRPQAAWIT